MQLEVAPGGRVHHDGLIMVFETEAAHMGQGGALSFAGVAEQATGGGQRGVQMIAAEPSQILSPKLLREQTSGGDRKSTRLNSSHVAISYAVFGLKNKKKTK